MRQYHNTPAMDDEGSALAAILDEFGADFLNRLRDGLGGLDFKVPRQSGALRDDHPLVMALGREDARALCTLLGGEQLYIPRSNNSKLHEVARAVMDGATTDEVALKLGISARHVRRLKQRIPDLTALMRAKQSSQAILTGA